MKKDNFIIYTLLGLFIFSALFVSFQHSDSKINTDIKVSPSFKNKNCVAVLYLYEPISIQSNKNWLVPSGADNFIAQLYELKKDKRVKAVVIRINSPGGTVGATQEIYREINKFKQQTKIPIIISVADTAASGAFWISMAGDYIVANPGSLVGNIGVIIGNLDLSNISEKYGIGYNLFKSGPYKDLLSSWRKPTKNDKTLIMGIINNLHEQFIAAVAAGRKLPLSKVKNLADGRIFTGSQAKKIGLIDGIGGLQDAIKLAGKIAGIPGQPVILQKQHKSFKELITLFSSTMFNNTGFESLFKLGVLAE